MLANLNIVITEYIKKSLIAKEEVHSVYLGTENRVDHLLLSDKCENRCAAYIEPQYCKTFST